MPHPYRPGGGRTPEQIGELTPWVPKEHRLTPKEFSGLGSGQGTPDLTLGPFSAPGGGKTQIDAMDDIHKIYQQAIQPLRQQQAYGQQVQIPSFDEFVNQSLAAGNQERIFGDTPVQPTAAPFYPPGGFEEIQRAKAKGAEIGTDWGPVQWSAEEGRRATQPIRNIPPPKSIYGR